MMLRYSLIAVLLFSACPTSPGYGPDDVLTDDLLQSPTLDVNSNARPVFHPILSAANYDSILQLNDLSYAVVNEFGHSLGQTYPGDDIIDAIRKRVVAIPQTLAARGWSPHQNILGKTGLDNIDDDVTAIVATHAAQRLIVFAFHGSRGGTRYAFLNDGHGDWGANHDAQPVVPSAVGIPEIPDDVRIYRGFGNNLASARQNLLTELDRGIHSLGPGGPVWVIITGHSKGGAMGALAMGLFKVHLNADSNQFGHVKLGAVFFASPRVYQGDHSQEWIHDLVGRTNILRINVSGDPVTLAPKRSETGYRSIGVLLLDYIWTVNMRNRQAYGANSFGWLNLSESVNVHYGSNGRGLSYEFDPNIVMRHQELATGFEEGRLYLRSLSVRR